LRTVVVSDLHLGSRTGIDVARRPELRAPLLALLDGADRLVLLGDTLELRQGPLHEALTASRGFFADIGAALGEGKEIVLVPGTTTTTSGCRGSSAGAVMPSPRRFASRSGSRRARRSRRRSSPAGPSPRSSSLRIPACGCATTCTRSTGTTSTATSRCRRSNGSPRAP